MKFWLIVAFLFVIALNTCHAVEPVHACPVPDDYNTGWVVADEDKDGLADHMYKVYNSGNCAGQLVDPNDSGINPELYKSDIRI